MECVELHVRVLHSNRPGRLFFHFCNEDLDLEMSGSVWLDYLFLQQKSVSALLYLDVTFGIMFEIHKWTKDTFPLAV